MKSTTSISVCLATYNGQAYVEQQVRSILEQLEPGDEVIVVDDCSTDATVEVLKRIGDPRIAIHQNERNRREVYSFGRALSLAKNSIIFMSDQDDIWMPGRAALMKKALLESGLSVVSSNMQWIGSSGSSIEVPCDGVAAANSARHFQNIADIFIGKTNYFGCAMAMRRELLPVVTPIPGFVESHDLWIALASNLARSNIHIDAQTLLKRKHSHNTTSTVSTRSLYRKLRARAIFAISIVVLLGRLKSKRTRWALRQA